MPRQNNYDVLIAGTGPAGLSAAIAAARGGLRVAVFERNKEIGYPIHTSGGSWLAPLRALEVPERFMHPIRTGQFIASQAKASFSYDPPVSCILDVRGLYQYLAAQAAQAGAHIFPSAVVERALMQEERPVGLAVRQHGQFFAPLLIDATGVAGVLAQQMNLRHALARYGLGAEYDVYWPAWPQDTIALLFGKLAPQGYGWIFPHGDSRVRIGIGVIHPDTKTEPRLLLNHLLAQKEIAGYPSPPRAAVEFHVGMIPATPPLNRTTAAGLLVVGDAGCLVSTLLGEGIRYALAIGRMAGETARTAHRAQRFDADFLARFETRWRQVYGNLFTWGFAINQRLAQYDDAAWNEKINLLAQFPAAVIPALLQGNFSMPELLSGLWRFSKKLSRQTLQALYNHIRAAQNIL